MLALLFVKLDHSFFFFFFNDTATTEIYTLSLHDALPISISIALRFLKTASDMPMLRKIPELAFSSRDRKSTRLNSSHSQISYAVFCLKKKNLREGSTVSEFMHHDRHVISDDRVGSRYLLL